METTNIDFSSYIPTPEQAAVIVSGIVSMGLEIVAGRVLAPQFGSSIYTWGSIIGISMFALSLGYHYGGKKSSNISSIDRPIFSLYIILYNSFNLCWRYNTILECRITCSSTLRLNNTCINTLWSAYLFPWIYKSLCSPTIVQTG